MTDLLWYFVYFQLLSVNYHIFLCACARVIIFVAYENKVRNDREWQTLWDWELKFRFFPKKNIINSCVAKHLIYRLSCWKDILPKLRVQHIFSTSNQIPFFLYRFETYFNQFVGINGRGNLLLLPTTIYLFFLVLPFLYHLSHGFVITLSHLIFWF